MGEGLLPFSEDLALRKKARRTRGEDAVADVTGMFHGQPVGGEKDAAERIVKSGRRASNLRIVLMLVQMYPGSTGAEMGQHTNLGAYEVRRRLTDLGGTGRIRQGATRKCAVAGTSAVTWWPVEGATDDE